jgi:hypothetical protein
MKEQVKWEAKNGKEITVTVELTTKETIWADGDEVEVNRVRMHIKAEVEGMGTVATSAPYKPNNLPAGVVAVMGKLGLSQERYDMVMAVIAKVEAAPEWQAKIAAEKQAMKIEEELEANRAKVYRAMNK